MPDLDSQGLEALELRRPDERKETCLRRDKTGSTPSMDKISQWAFKIPYSALAIYSCLVIQMGDKPNTTPIGQDREILTLKTLLYLNVAACAQVCRLFCVVYMPCSPAISRTRFFSIGKEGSALRRRFWRFLSHFLAFVEGTVKHPWPTLVNFCTFPATSADKRWTVNSSPRRWF